MNFQPLAALRKLLADMEQDMGVDGLRAAQRDLLYAVQLLGRGDNAVSAAELQEHALIARISRATFFRALQDLVQRGYLEHASNRRDGYLIPTGKYRKN